MSRWGDFFLYIGLWILLYRKNVNLFLLLFQTTRKWDQMVTKMFEFHVRSAIIYTCSSPPFSNRLHPVQISHLKQIFVVVAIVCAALCRRIFTSSLYVSFLLAVKVILMSNVLLRVAQSLDIDICRVCALRKMLQVCCRISSWSSASEMRIFCLRCCGSDVVSIVYLGEFCVNFNFFPDFFFFFCEPSHFHPFAKHVLISFCCYFFFVGSRSLQCEIFRRFFSLQFYGITKSTRKHIRHTILWWWNFFSKWREWVSEKDDNNSKRSRENFQLLFFCVYCFWFYVFTVTQLTDHLCWLASLSSACDRSLRRRREAGKNTKKKTNSHILVLAEKKFGIQEK